MRTSWILIVGLLSFALAGCAASPTVADLPAPENKDVISSLATATVVAAGEWQTYSNTQAGYSAQYPADWMVNESSGGSGEHVTTFMAPGDGQGLMVTVLPGKTTGEEIPDIPNTRCQPVTISGLPGQRCLDTVALSTSTTFSGDNRQFAIVAIGKKPDLNVYQRFLENFIVTP